MAANYRILLLNGPNLNMLGVREPSVYGTASLSDIVQELQSQATTLNVNLSHFQSNAEHELINAIQQSLGQQDYILINPGAFTHTSIAMRDALLAVAIPFIEIHLSNVHAREAFRRHSYLADIAKGVICGLGAKGYHYALDAAVAALHTTK
ncbi:3-dehydroquinate dehydratase [Arsukibacterium sp. MJ3]|jgi:3-dehydroquinate dehydratase-2|uniref:type II 3-dehydroquinate dehydratase n=1 Tax=Arsukibacterium sp. MJ3 TaxID=1632859 RepID=UPI0006273EA1|nr:type II 3-dehydroquinate dehydratase [Arsukibacterium sp. MJ3]KKO48226.1 3-dehydroquinate dehydratase [Arsukibacterium sp. MJ3]